MLACPRVSPEWELGMLHVLMKPKPATRGAVEHRGGEQPWPAGADAALDDVLGIMRERLGTEAVIHRMAKGAYHFLIEYAPAQRPEMLALAQLLSRRLPELWFVLDRLFVYGGMFYRRQFGYKLNLVPASNVHLPRAVRSALRGVI
jgi:hypothetical protein